MYPEINRAKLTNNGNTTLLLLTSIRKKFGRKYYTYTIQKSFVFKGENVDVESYMFECMKEFIVEVYKHQVLLKLDKELKDILTNKPIFTLDVIQISEEQRIMNKYYKI